MGMGKMRVVAVTAVLGAVLALPATGAVGGRQADQWTPTAGGFQSGVLEYVTSQPLAAGVAMDATLHDGYLYLSQWRSFSIYDVRDPLDPKHVSTTPLRPFLFNERPQTNGEILLVSGDFQGGQPGILEIYDVRDKSKPVRLSSTEFPAFTTHIWECVDDCRYAYGTYGRILDLSDPTAPRDIGDWRDATSGEFHGYHTLRLVAPDRMVVGADPVVVLDVSDPAAPVELASFRPDSTVPNRTYLVAGVPRSLPARVDWPQDGTDPFLLISMETPFSGPCNERSGDFLVYAAPDLDDQKVPPVFELMDRYGVQSDGTYVDGGAAFKVFGCSAYGMESAPGFAGGGLVATAWMEDGVRLLEVDDAGAITEVGGFLPHGGASSGFVWPADDVLYAIDIHRGLDVLRIRQP